MKMKKFLSVLLVCLPVFTLIGCSPKGNKAEETIGTEQLTKTPTEASTEALTEAPVETSAAYVLNVPEKDVAQLIEFEAADQLEGSAAEDTSDENGGKHLGQIKAGGYAAFRKMNFGEGKYGKILVRAASAAQGGDMEIRRGAADGGLLGTIHIEGTEGGSTWKTFEAFIPSAEALTGLSDIYFVFTGTDNVYNLNWFQFKQGPVDAAGRIEAENAAEAFDVVAEDNTDGEGARGIGGVNNGDYSMFDVDFGEGGYAGATFRASSGMEDGGDIEVHLGAVDGELLGTVHIDGTGDRSSWQDFSGTLEGIKNLTGVQKIVLVYTNGGDSLFDLNWFRFDKAPFDAANVIQVEDFFESADVAVEANADGENQMGIGGVNNDEYTAYKINFSDGGYKKFTVRASSAMESGGDVEIHIGAIDGQLVGTCHVDNTGDWSTWADFTADCPDLTSVTGEQTVYLKFVNGGEWLFNVNWFRFDK